MAPNDPEFEALVANYRERLECSSRNPRISELFTQTLTWRSGLSHILLASSRQTLGTQYRCFLARIPDSTNLACDTAERELSGLTHRNRPITVVKSCRRDVGDIYFVLFCTPAPRLQLPPQLPLSLALPSPSLLPSFLPQASAPSEDNKAH